MTQSKEQRRLMLETLRARPEPVFHVAADEIESLEGLMDSLGRALTRILEDLPSRKDWLETGNEREGRGMLARWEKAKAQRVKP